MKKSFYIALSLFFILMLSPLFAALPANTMQSGHGFSSMLEKAMPAIVNITVQGELPPFPMPYGPNAQNNGPQAPNGAFMRPRKFQDMGSGVIVNAKKGLIVTNAHVLKNANTIVVALNDGRRVRAKQVGIDIPTDLAVIKIKASHLTAIPFANSNTLKIGDFVAAIGNPYGLQQSVTSGVISALHRSIGIEGPNSYENFIQTDASINPGNSGGALINLQGQLVGINSAILAPVPGNVGIGFAIPSNMAREVLKQITAEGKVKRGVLGVLVQDFTPNLADAFHISGVKGAIITEVKPNSAAAKAGLHEKDIIEMINGQPVHSGSELRSLVGLTPVNQPVKLRVHHGNKTMIRTVKLEAMEKEKKDVMVHPLNLLEGVQLQNHDAYSPTTGELKGVLVTRVADSTNAWLARLRPGDIIMNANGTRTSSIDQLLHVVHDDRKQLLLKVWRAGGTLYLVISQNV